MIQHLSLGKPRHLKCILSVLQHQLFLQNVQTLAGHVSVVCRNMQWCNVNTFLWCTGCCWYHNELYALYVLLHVLFPRAHIPADYSLHYQSNMFLIIRQTGRHLKCMIRQKGSPTSLKLCQQKQWSIALLMLLEMWSWYLRWERRFTVQCICW